MSVLRRIPPHRFAFVGAGILAALAGCRGILGIQDERTIDCLVDADCSTGQFCNAGFCAPLDGSANDLDGGGDAAADTAPAITSPDADAAIHDATLEDRADVVSDAEMEAEGATPPDGTGPTDTGTDRTSPAGDATPGPDAADATSVDASDATVTDTGADASNANDASEAGDAEAGSCGAVSSSGTCAQCSGSCAVHRPGFLNSQGGVSVVDAHTFVAVQIAVPSPSWLLRLGIDTFNNNIVGQLALYEDSSGQPGAFVTKVDITTFYDPATDGTETAVDCEALCIPLTQGTYWVGAVFETSLGVLSDNGYDTTIYQGDAPYPDGGTLDDGVVPPGAISTGALDRNIYMVVTEP